MLTYYMSKYLLKADGGRNAATIVVDGVEESHIKDAAEATKGFSGEISSRVFVAAVVIFVVALDGRCSIIFLLGWAYVYVSNALRSTFSSTAGIILI